MSLFPGIIANQPNPEAVRRNRAKYAAEQKRKAEQQEKELRGLARPLVEYLEENYHPHMTVVINDERVVIVEDVRTVYFMEEEPDNGQ